MLVLTVEHKLSMRQTASRKGISTLILLSGTGIANEAATLEGVWPSDTRLMHRECWVLRCFKPLSVQVFVYSICSPLKVRILSKASAELMMTAARSQLGPVCKCRSYVCR